jgi:hypothetical protein
VQDARRERTALAGQLNAARIELQEFRSAPFVDADKRQREQSDMSEKIRRLEERVSGLDALIVEREQELTMARSDASDAAIVAQSLTAAISDRIMARELERQA